LFFHSLYNLKYFSWATKDPVYRKSKLPLNYYAFTAILPIIFVFQSFEYFLDNEQYRGTLSLFQVLGIIQLVLRIITRFFDILDQFFLGSCNSVPIFILLQKIAGFLNKSRQFLLKSSKNHERIHYVNFFECSKLFSRYWWLFRNFFVFFEIKLTKVVSQRQLEGIQDTSNASFQLSQCFLTLFISWQYWDKVYRWILGWLRSQPFY
jgi:hypothetical protein